MFQENPMSFLASLRAAFKGGAQARQYAEGRTL